MNHPRGYSTQPLSFNRKAVQASASVTSAKNTIHSLTEVDITPVRKMIRTHFDKTGKKLSLTAYVVTCLAHTIKGHPHLNAFIKGRKMVLLDDVTLSVLIEKEIEGERVPEPIGILEAQNKSHQQIQSEIRSAQSQRNDKLGSFSGISWIRFIPGALLRTFIRIADKNITMAKRYGKIAVTATGMFSEEPSWFIPHGSPTVLLTVGSISNKVVELEGQFVTREYLHLTASFDHDVVDGAPAARFMTELLKSIGSGDLLDSTSHSVQNKKT